MAVKMSILLLVCVCVFFFFFFGYFNVKFSLLLIKVESFNAFLREALRIPINRIH
jgi:hypothetical protein